jgi:hypothetical protein
MEQAHLTPPRKLIEDLWRERLEAHRQSYEQARREAAKALAESAQGLCQRPDGSFAVQKALRGETRARDEYMRVLRTFADLHLNGKLPEVPDF